MLHTGGLIGDPGGMASPDPLRSVRTLLPDLDVRAAGVFGLQDRAVASGLLGSEAVGHSTVGLARVAGGHPREIARIEYALPRIPVSVLVAVSDGWIHVCSWDSRRGCGAELTRLDRAAATVTVERYKNARRVILMDGPTRYRLVLTATVSRLHPYGPGARAVLALLPAMAPPAPVYPVGGNL